MLVFLQMPKGESKAIVQRSPPDTGILKKALKFLGHPKILKNLIWCFHNCQAVTKARGCLEPVFCPRAASYTQGLDNSPGGDFCAWELRSAFENEPASFKKTVRQNMLPHPCSKHISWAGSVQARALGLYGSARTCHGVPDNYVSSSLHWQRLV